MAIDSRPALRPKRRRSVAVLGGDLADFADDRLACMTRVLHERGPAAPMRLGVLRALLLSDPQEIEAVLVRRNAEFGKHYLPTVGGMLLGNGLFTSTGDFWLRQRRLLQPAFHRARIAEYGQVMVRYARELVEEWRDGEVRDVADDMMRLTLRIVARTLFDADVEGEARAVGEAMSIVRRCFEAKLNAFLPFPDRIPTRATRRLRAAVRELDAIVYRMIAERRRSPGDRGDLLSLLLSAHDEGGDMTDRQLRDEAMSLFVGGHETTAVGLTWTWHLLGAHPDVEAAVRRELDEVLGERLPSVDDLPRLRQTERAIRESMRLYPPVYAFDRTPTRDCTIAGRSVRAGTIVLISPYVVHRRADLYEHPQDFRPDRWGAGAADLPRYAYLPFGGGPRICIGSRFAETEMTLVLAAMLQQASVRPHTSAVTADPSITLRPRGGLPMVVQRRAEANLGAPARFDVSPPDGTPHLIERTNTRL
jgi:cytochrome P450